MAEQQPINIDLSKSKTKPVFADEIAIAVRMKAFKNDKGKVEKEANVELIFMDIMKRQSVGEFVIGRTTARGLIVALNQTLENLEKELANKEMPKQPEIKTTGDTSSYIR